MRFKETGRSFLRWTRNFFDAVPPEEIEREPTTASPEHGAADEAHVSAADNDTAQTGTGTSPPTVDDNATFALLEDITRGLGLRREDDLNRLFKGGAVVAGLITELFLFLAVVGLFVFGPQIAEVIGAGVSAIVEAAAGGTGGAPGDAGAGQAGATPAAIPRAVQLVPGVLAAMFAVMMAAVGARTAARALRRRALVRMVTAVARNLDVDPETIRRFFQRRFGYEWKKLG
jgi:hypothetical protein